MSELNDLTDRCDLCRESVRDKLAAHPDLLPIWSDNITNEAHDGYVAKLDALISAAPAAANP